LPLKVSAPHFQRSIESRRLVAWHRDGVLFHVDQILEDVVPDFLLQFLGPEELKDMRYVSPILPARSFRVLNPNGIPNPVERFVYVALELA
jgi:hypothetical protein